MATLKEQIMRYTPAALALALLAGVTSSIGQSATPTPLDPRAAALLQQGRTALAAGNVDGAIDAYESALAVQPGHVAILLNLAEATRKQGMQGKALHYYREALKIAPANLRKALYDLQNELPVSLSLDEVERLSTGALITIEPGNPDRYKLRYGIYHDFFGRDQVRRAR